MAASVTTSPKNSPGVGVRWVAGERITSEDTTVPHHLLNSRTKLMRGSFDIRNIKELLFLAVRVPCPFIPRTGGTYVRLTNNPLRFAVSLGIFAAMLFSATTVLAQDNPAFMVT